LLDDWNADFERHIEIVGELLPDPGVERKEETPGLATFRRKIHVFGRMAYGGGKGKSPPGGAWRAGAAKIAG
jgi:hypothetical protein